MNMRHTLTQHTGGITHDNEVPGTSETQVFPAGNPQQVEAVKKNKKIALYVHADFLGQEVTGGSKVGRVAVLEEAHGKGG